MPTATNPGYRTKRVAFRGDGGRATSYLRVPDKADPAYQAHLDEHYAQLDALLAYAAKDLDMTPEELAERLSQD